MNRTLFLGIDNQETSNSLRQLFADLEYIGHIKKYGNCCLFISTLVQRILQAQGVNVELKTCNAIVERSEVRFLLGGKQFTKPGQLATHVVCIVDGNILIDFGLGNVRRYFYSDFFQAVVLPYNSAAETLSSAKLDQSTSLYYIHDAIPEELASEQSFQEPTMQQALQEYTQYQKNRFRFSLARAFRCMGFRTKTKKPILNTGLHAVQAKFDDTFFS
ncbi:hypothetical protein H8K35_18145 [Undibacterium sp. LX40W]|uniref:Uncharacterized protein n=1 Tax=Undibacterium nitidum TaxID=2762298 RepID=A0A923KMW1_9BURK|nr:MULTISPECIES: hypothetical protein [Undibacterium]MBC3883320.1 hypothetical protein [Undibacterium nitidum]MBC3893602.1 hypothetical protein [Undibacterium sp. LX40W]